jgi:hypothetical protein
VLADLPILPQLWEQAAGWDALKDPANAAIQAYSQHGNVAAAVHSSKLIFGFGPDVPTSSTSKPLDRPARRRLMRESGRRMLSAWSRPRPHNNDSGTDGNASTGGNGTAAV